MKILFQMCRKFYTIKIINNNFTVILYKIKLKKFLSQNKVCLKTSKEKEITSNTATYYQIKNHIRTLSNIQ